MSLNFHNFLFSYFFLIQRLIRLNNIFLRLFFSHLELLLYVTKKKEQLKLFLIFLPCRDEVYNQLLLIDSYVVDLTSSRNVLNELECRRNVLSKQISLVRDVEALGMAMQSHSLNTLSQRYSILKKRRNDVFMMRNILLEKASEAEKMIGDYLSFIGDTKALGNYLDEMKSRHAAICTVSEFDIIKDFLESSNQGQLWMQADQLRREMNVSMNQRAAVVEASIEALLQYRNVMCFYPHDHVQNHRLTKYSAWSRSLVDNKSREHTRQIAMSYHNTFGNGEHDQYQQQQPEKLVAFNFHLQTYLAEVNYQSLENYQRYQQFIEMDRSYIELQEEFHEFLLQQDVNNNGIAVELMKMTKRLLALELSTHTNRNNLTNLIINDRWYMDEIKIQVSFLANVIEKESTILIQKNNRHQPLLNNSFECFRTIAETLETFDRIKYDFQLNIIPLALNGVISQDKSVLDMIATLSNISQTPIGDLLAKLEEDFLNCVNNPNQKGLLRAAELTEAYNNIYAHYQTSTNNNKNNEDNAEVDDIGKKLFMFFHGAFDEICRLVKKIMGFDKALHAITENWSSMTEIQQSRALFISPMKTTIFMTLDQLLIVKCIQTMIDFFSNCLQVAWAFKGSGGVINFDIEHFSQPLKAFITELLIKCILGRGTYCMSLFICCLLDNENDNGGGSGVNNKYFSLDQLRITMSSNSSSSSSSSLFMYCENFFVSLEEKFRRQESGSYYQKLIHQQSEIIEHITYMMSAHHWLNEDYFAATNIPLPPIPRGNILMQLQASIQSLTSWHLSLNKIDEELKACTLSIMQRLKWAAGANPLINDLMNKFESISNANAISCQRENKYAEKTLKYSLATINYEMLRFKTPKAIMGDEELLNFLQQWENVCHAERQVAHTVTPIEEGLIELLNPDGPIDSMWIENVTTLIDEMINQVHNEIDSNEKIMVNAQDNLHLVAHKLRNLMTNHHRIFSDMKSLLKSILKSDDGNEMLKEYFAKHKNFIDIINELHGNVLSKDFTDVMMKQIKEQVEKALTVSNDIYNELFSFERNLFSNENVMNENPSPGTPMKKSKFNSLGLIE